MLDLLEQADDTFAEADEALRKATRSGGPRLTAEAEELVQQALEAAEAAASPAADAADQVADADA